MRGSRGPFVPSFQPASINVHSKVAYWKRANFRCARVTLAPVAFDRSEFLSESAGEGAETFICFGRDLWLVVASNPSFREAPVTSADTWSFLESKVCNPMLRPFLRLRFAVLYCKFLYQLGLMFRRC